MRISTKNRLAIYVCLAFLLASNLSIARGKSIWGAPLPLEPFDKEPLRPIRIPEWVKETVGVGYTLSVSSSEDRVRAIERGVTISELGFVDPLYVYYESDLLERHNPAVPLDRIERECEEYDRLGLRILAVYPPCLQGEIYEKHPDWRRIPTNTTAIPQVNMEKHPYGGMLCLLGPYGDFFIEVLVEIITKFPEVDAFTFDGLHYGSVCYCQHCRENFRAETSQGIPDPDLNDPAFRRYQYWADRRMENLIVRMQERLKGINPEVALITWTTNAGRFGHFLSVPRNMPSRMNLLLDAPDQEFWMDESNRGSSIVPAFANAYIWTTTNHRVAFSEPYLMTHGNPYGKDSFPPHEIFCRMMLALTYGACPSIAYIQPPNLRQGVDECLEELQKRKYWLTHKRPEPWAALMMSDNTRNFYGRSAGLVEERYMSNVFGTFRVAVEEHLQVNLINDWNLTPCDLAHYDLLLLPNTACMAEQQVEAVRKFVRNGGGLVASVDVSLFDEYGDPQEDFALKDVLGVGYQGTPDSAAGQEQIDVNFAKSISPDYWEKRKNVFDYWNIQDSFLNQGLMTDYVGYSPVTFKGQALCVKTAGAGARVVATMKARGISGAPEIPAVIANTFGKGKVVYLAAGLDSAYYLYAYPYQRLVLKEAMRWAAASPPGIEVEAPMCVHSTFMRQNKNDIQRLIVHLFNDLNTTAFHALAVDDVPLREEAVPVHDIRVRFNADYPIERIHLEPEGIDLSASEHENTIEITIPELEVHSMVVVELRL